MIKFCQVSLLFGPGINIGLFCLLAGHRLIKMKISGTFFVLSIILIVPCLYNEANAQQAFKERNFLQTETKPSVADPYLKVELIVDGLHLPTAMAFLGPDDFLVLEKDKGTVLRVTNG